METLSRKIETENDKKPKIFHFQSFYGFFVKVLTDFVDYNVE